MFLEKIAFSIIAILVIFTLSCHKVGKTVEIKETVKVTYRDTTIVVPGQLVSSSINYDSLKMVFQQYLNAGLKPQIIYRNTPSSPTSLTIRLDSLGVLRADCETSEQFIEFQQKEIERLLSVKERIVVEKTPVWVFYFIGGVILSIFILILIKTLF